MEEEKELHRRALREKQSEMQEKEEGLTRRKNEEMEAQL